MTGTERPCNMTDQTTVAHSLTLQDQATRRVSFVLTTRNRAQIIGEALKRARALVKENDELIIVDGASSDETSEIVASYGDLVDLFISEPDTSPTHALNKGVLVARGKYVKHLTDDDDFFPEAMEQAIALLEANPQVDVLVCGGTRQLGDDVYPVYVPPRINYGKSPEDVFNHGVCGCGLLIRRSSLSLTGLASSIGVATDAEFVAKAIYNGAQVKFCRVNLFHHPIYNHSAISAMKPEHEEDMDRISKQYCSRAFYLKFRIKSLILRNRLLRWPTLAVRNTLRRTLAALGNKRARAKLSPEEPVWDGGFS